MGDMSSPFKDGVMGMPSVDPRVPIKNAAGDALATPFVDGPVNTSGGGVSIPPGMAIGNLTQGPLATPFKDGPMKGKNS
jgi:hypothetical protein